MKKKPVAAVDKVKESQIEDRAARGARRELADGWQAVARGWARGKSRDSRDVLDLFDDLASVRYYSGMTWDEAQAAAWNDTREILERHASRAHSTAA